MTVFAIFSRLSRRQMCVVVMAACVSRTLATVANEPELLWKASLGGDSGPVVASSEHVVVGTRSPGGDVAEVRCFAIETGKHLWTAVHERLEHAWLDNPRSAIRSRPVIAGDRVVYYSNRAEVVCVDLNGWSDDEDDGTARRFGNDASEADVVWKCDLREELNVFKRDELNVGCPSPSPLVIGDRVYCATGNGATHGLERFIGQKPFVVSPLAPACICLSLTNGALIWSSSAGSATTIHSSVASPLFGPTTSGNLKSANRLAFTGGDGKLYVLSSEDGATISKSDNNWNFWCWQSPVLCDTHIVLCTSIPPGTPISGRNPVVVGFEKDSLFTSARTPRQQWLFRDAGYEGTWVPPVYARGILFVVTNSGRLLAIDARNGQLLWDDEIDYEVWEFPEMKLYNDTLLIPVGTELYGYKVARVREREILVDLGVLLKSGWSIVGDQLLAADGNSLYSFKLNELLP